MRTNYVLEIVEHKAPFSTMYVARVKKFEVCTPNLTYQSSYEYFETWYVWGKLNSYGSLMISLAIHTRDR